MFLANTDEPSDATREAACMGGCTLRGGRSWRIRTLLMQTSGCWGRNIERPNHPRPRTGFAHYAERYAAYLNAG